AVQARQLLLSHHWALPGLTQLRLRLLQLGLMAALVLLTLLAAGLAVVFQRITGVLVFFLQRADLPIAVFQAPLQVLRGLEGPGQLQLALLQLLAQLFVGSLLFGQPGAQFAVLRLRLPQTLFTVLQPLLPRQALAGQFGAFFGHGFGGFFPQRLGQLPDDLAEALAERHSRLHRQWRGTSLQLLEIAMDGAFRTGIAQLDTNRIDART